jgi:hypothetical protein
MEVILELFSGQEQVYITLKLVLFSAYIFDLYHQWKEICPAIPWHFNDL